MIFQRSQPRRQYRDYARHRPQLRRDFHYRCAYCLTHEYYLGGEAGCCIDHFRPVKGAYARPDLETDYANLYWCCRECNENKADTWPSPEQEARGERFLDPCCPDDDPELHYLVLPNGSLEPLTQAGLYTIRQLKLWRPQLQYQRALLYGLREEETTFLRLLVEKDMNSERRELLERRLAEIRLGLEPPAFDRPHGDERPT
jgi:uncharacterized protein (TIGR02646 family)